MSTDNDGINVQSRETPTPIYLGVSAFVLIAGLNAFIVLLGLSNADFSSLSSIVINVFRLPSMVILFGCFALSWTILATKGRYMMLGFIVILGSIAFTLGVPLFADTTAQKHIVTSELGVPDAPLDLSATIEFERTTLSWLAPPRAEEILYYEYRIRYGSYTWDTADSDWTYIPDEFVDELRSRLAYIIEGLDSGVHYTFEVRAVNKIGPSRASFPASVVPDVVPGPVAGPILHGYEESVLVKWLPPNPALSVVYAPPNGYTIWYASEGDDEGRWIDVGDSLEYLVDGLVDGVDYSFEVRAYNTVGTGPSVYTLSLIHISEPTRPY